MSVNLQQLGCKELVNIIKSEIASSPHQAISFYQFMGLCLYHPEYGYYSKRRLKIGKEGDFYTSASIGSIMGEMLAQSFVRMAQKQSWDHGTIHLVEWGGGTGQLARHILDELRNVFPEMYERIVYTSVERSDYHRQLQREMLSEHEKHTQWLEAQKWFQKGSKTQTIIYSNELLDAFPVHRILYQELSYHEVYVGWDSNLQRFDERLVPLSEGPILNYIIEEAITLCEGQQAEINLDARHWINSIGEWLESGVLITIDYGDEAREIYESHRMNGTLMCYRQHQAHDNPYIHVGEQDITSHVNFSACIHSGQSAGFEEWTLTDQKQFLIQSGIMDKLQTHVVTDPFHPIAKKNRAIRQLLLSDQMSELFKVLIQYKKSTLKKGD